MEEKAFVEWVRIHWDIGEKESGIYNSKDPIYLAASMMGEAAEVWDVIKKPYRRREMVELDRLELDRELGDTYHYLVKLAELYGLDVGDIREQWREVYPHSDNVVHLSGMLMGRTANVWRIIEHALLVEEDEVELKSLSFELAKVYAVIGRIAGLYGLSMNDLRATNYTKLIERYGDRANEATV